MPRKKKEVSRPMEIEEDPPSSDPLNISSQRVSIPSSEKRDIIDRRTRAGRRIPRTGHEDGVVLGDGDLVPPSDEEEYEVWAQGREVSDDGDEGSELGPSQSEDEGYDFVGTPE
jgi:hypothetical protein